MREMDEASVDAVVTDPPWHLTFMGRAWDHAPSPRESQVMHLAWATEALRVLKPGGHMLAAGSSRTFHRLVCAIEDAGFEVRDTITHHYGSGFPKSACVSKAIDKRGGNAHLAVEIAAAIKAARERRGWSTGQADRHFCGGTTNWTWYEGRKGQCRPPAPADFARIVSEWPELRALAEKVAQVERDVLGRSDELFGRKSGIGNAAEGHYTVGGTQAEGYDITAPATPEAEQWQGWGTALKPSTEFWCVARKSLIGNVARNVLEFGTGAINVDGCRVGTDGRPKIISGQDPSKRGAVYEGGDGLFGSKSDGNTSQGRWPPNAVFSHAEGCQQVGTRRVKSQNPVMRNDQQAHGGYHGISKRKAGTALGHADPDGTEEVEAWTCAEDCPVAELGEQARFFPTFRYVAKSSRRERNAGLEGFEAREQSDFHRPTSTFSQGRDPKTGERTGRVLPPAKNGHPTVKPLALMRWLVRLVTPLGGTVLDPFTGSGSTGCAAVVEGFNFVGLEDEAEYVETSRARIAHWQRVKDSEPLTLGMDTVA